MTSNRLYKPNVLFVRSIDLIFQLPDNNLNTFTTKIILTYY